MIGTTEILVIALVIMVLFGAAAIPRFARNLGRAKKEFQEGLKEGESSEDPSDQSELKNEKEE